MQASSPAADQVVRFPGPIAIVGGGTVAPAVLRTLHDHGVALVGADSGADTIGEAGLVPALVVGDLDSVRDAAAWASRTQVLHLPDQITTDFQKALRSTAAPVTLVVGMTGKRLDHTLAALSAVLEWASRRHLVVIDETDIALAVVGAFAFPAKDGERVSIHPLLPIHFTHSDGLLYPLDGLELAPGALLGTSNSATGGFVRIEPAPISTQTPWLLIVPGARLWDLLAILNEGGPGA